MILLKRKEAWCLYYINIIQEKMSSLTYRITSIPDLTLSKYQLFADSGIDGMLEAQTQLLRLLNRTAILGNVSIHFLMTYDPLKAAGSRMDLYLMFSNHGGSNRFDDKIKKVMASEGIFTYFSMEECSDSNIPDTEFAKMAILHKKERSLQTAINGEEQFFYVVPNWKMNEHGRLYSLFKLAESFNEKCCYRVDLYVEEDLEDKIHTCFEQPLSYLRNISKKSRGISELSRFQQDKRDPNADETLHQYEDWLKSIDTMPAFLCRICAFSDDEDYSRLLLDSAVSENLKSGNVRMITRSGKYTFRSAMEYYTPYCSEGIPLIMNKWATTFTVEEIAPFMRFPVLYDGETIELPKETAAAREADGIVIGRDYNGYDVMLPLETLPKHMFVCGTPGSGKTNTMLHLANSLWKQKIPFLVLEPAKREYRELALFNIPELIIFSPSACTDFPLQLNPFEFAKGLTLSEHIGNLCQVFEGAFPIVSPAPFILDRAIQKIYENHGWVTNDINTGILEYPTLSELYDQFALELENTTYDGEIRGNIQSVLEMRIGSLLRREKKAIFDVHRSTLSPEEWLKYPVVIELEALGEGPANFVTLLLCTLIREVLKVSPRIDKGKTLRHMIFIEEAHNLIAQESQVGDENNSNPKIAATAYIVKMLAEVRALKEGIIIADQLPTAMAPEVIKNTNVKLVHRLTSGDDRELIGGTMSASALQVEHMATYTSGQALMTYEKLLRPFELQVCLVEEHGEQTPDDRQLLQIMLQKPLYFNLRRKLEYEKFERLKKDTIKALDKEEMYCKELETINLAYMTETETEAWAIKTTHIIDELKKNRSHLRKESEILNERFLDSSNIPELQRTISGISIRYESVLKSVLQTLNGYRR